MNWLKRLKDLFVPHEGNDFRPDSLEKAAVLGMMVLVFLSFAVANLQSFLWLTSDFLVSTILPAVIVEETNDNRQLLELSPLRRDELLDQAAQLKAEDMAKGSYFSHNSPDGRTPWYWFDEVSYKYVHAGENLAVHFTDSSDVVEAWMNSPSHRANILNGDYREIGIGTAKGKYEGFDTVFVVQLFGTKASANVAVAPPVTTPIEITDADELESASALVAGEATDTSETSIPREVAGATKDDVVSNSDTNAVDVGEDISFSSSSPSSTPIKEVEVTDDGVVVYSSYVSTSTGGIPASIEEEGTPIYESTAPIASVATKPHLVLQILYLIIGAFVFVALMISIIFEMRRHQSVQLAYGVGLMVTMFALFYIHISLSSGVLIV